MNFFMRSDEDNDRNTASDTPGYPSQSTVIETRSIDSTRSSTRNSASTRNSTRNNTRNR